MKIFITLLLFLSCCGYVIAEPPGEYDIAISYRANPIPKKNSLDSVELTEVFSFTCPHCNRFRMELAKLQKLFGDKLIVTSYPIGWVGHNPGKLYYMALEKSQEMAEKVKDDIFDSIFLANMGNAINDPNILIFIAQEHGLAEGFEQKLNSKAIETKMKHGLTYIKDFNVTSTPTIFLQDAIKLTGDPKNLAKIINYLLVQQVDVSSYL